MASFVYFYSKFTDEFLLLTAGAMFALLAYYCYHWAMNRRRLGSTPNQVPAGVVKEYLNQLINEAQFIRTQLFGILSGLNDKSPGDIEALFGSISHGPGHGHDSLADDVSVSSDEHGGSGGVSSDLLERLKSLEAQLAEKEGMIVNVNVEKNKLLQEVDLFKKNQKASAPIAGGGNNDELLKRLKMLEQQLEEYNMFEDDLANIKRIQQENDQLKRRIEEMAAYANAVPAAGAPSANFETVNGKEANKAPSLDQASIDALLEGESPVPPNISALSEIVSPAMETTVADADPALVQSAANAAPLTADAFENLVNNVETSFSEPTPEAVASAVAAETEQQPQAQQAQAVTPPAPEPQVAAAVEMSKSDEELLKEFENLLNSG